MDDVVRFLRQLWAIRLLLITLAVTRARSIRAELPGRQRQRDPRSKRAS
jgi:hypothetical protein